MGEKFKGYLLAIVAAATYGTNPLFAVNLYRDGMDPVSVLFWRYLVAVPIVAIMIKARGRSFRLCASQAWMLLGLGILMAVSSLGLFMSYEYMNSGIASTLLFIYPVMVAVIMAIIYRERLPLTTWVCILVALCGIGLLCHPGPDGLSISLIGITFVMLSSLAYAVYMIAVNAKSLKALPTLTVTFYVLSFGILVFAVPLIFTGDLRMPTQTLYWGNVLGLAIFPTVISFLCTTAAVGYIGATPTAILGALEPVTAVVLSVTLLGQPIAGTDWIGMLLVIIAVTLVVAGGKISAPLVRIRKMFPSLLHRKK